MTTMIQYEGMVDETIAVFLPIPQDRLADKVGESGKVNWLIWLHYFTDDAITKITYGERLGHLEAGRDVDGILKSMFAGGHLWEKGELLMI